MERVRRACARDVEHAGHFGLAFFFFFFFEELALRFYERVVYFPSSHTRAREAGIPKVSREHGYDAPRARGLYPHFGEIYNTSDLLSPISK